MVSCKHRHHAEAEQIDLDDAEIFAVVLVPLRDDAAGHRGIFQRHEGAELVLANDHAARVLAEMTRQALHQLVKLARRRGARDGSRGTPACVSCACKSSVCGKVAIGQTSAEKRPSTSGEKLSALPISRIALRPR